MVDRVVVVWVAAGWTTAVSRVLVVVLVVTGSDAQELRSTVATMQSSELRMVSFFIVRWFSSYKDSSQVPSADVLK